MNGAVIFSRSTRAIRRKQNDYTYIIPLLLVLYYSPYSYCSPYLQLERVPLYILNVNILCLLVIFRVLTSVMCCVFFIKVEILSDL